MTISSPTLDAIINALEELQGVVLIQKHVLLVAYKNISTMLLYVNHKLRVDLYCIHFLCPSTSLSLDISFVIKFSKQREDCQVLRYKAPEYPPREITALLKQ